MDSSDLTRLATDTYFVHPDFNPTTLEADLGLIQLRLPITLTGMWQCFMWNKLSGSISDYIQPIGLPSRDVQTFAVVSAIGWGQVNDGKFEKNYNNIF